MASADDLPPFPLHCSWVREGLLVVGLDNEMHVYNQWHADSQPQKLQQQQQKKQQKQLETSVPLPAASMTVARLTKTYSTFGLSRCDSTHTMESMKQQQPTQSSPTASGGTQQLDFAAFIQDIGMFEAVQVCNPVLPQYHPRQLMEWINFGKLRRVKAILAHLTRCGAPTTATVQRRGSVSQRPHFAR